MNKALIVILAAVTIDAIGIGLIFPILPALLREVTHAGEVATLFGISGALAQGLLVGPLSRRFGDLGTLMIGIGFDTLAYLLMGFADHGWMGFAVTPLFALGGISMPALQSLMTSKVSKDQQGQLQGVLASLMSLTQVVGPLFGTLIYFYTKDIWLGTVWIVGALLYVAAVPLFATIRTPKPVNA